MCALTHALAKVYLKSIEAESLLLELRLKTKNDVQAETKSDVMS